MLAFIRGTIGLVLLSLASNPRLTLHKKWDCFNAAPMLFQKMNHEITYSLTHSRTHSRTHSLTHALAQITQSLTHSLTHSRTHSITHSITQAIARSLTHPLTHPLAHAPTHPLTQSLAHSGTLLKSRDVHLAVHAGSTNVTTHITHPFSARGANTLAGGP